MSKKFKLIDIPTLPVSEKHEQEKTDWELCIIWQEEKKESLLCPANSKRHDLGCGYKYMAEHLLQFNDLGQPPTSLTIDRLDEGQGIEVALLANKAV